MDEKEIKKLERANSILEVARELGIKTYSNMGQCFQQGKHPEDAEEFTLFFNLAKNKFFCKTCSDIGGSVIDLVRQIKGWDREKAVEWLAHRVEYDQKTKKLYHGKGRKK